MSKSIKRFQIKFTKMYYSLVDNYYNADLTINENNFKLLIDLFSKDVMYIRCEKKIIGRSELIDFYKNERKILGTHKIHEIMTSEQKENTIIVVGEFNGIDKNNQTIKIPFTDLFYFDGAEIKIRKTFIGLGFDNTK